MIRNKQTINDEHEQAAWQADQLFVGIDEAGLGSVVSSCFVGLAVFPKNYDFQTRLADVNDSKKLTEDKRNHLATIIKEEALYWDVQGVTAAEIDAGSAYHLRFDMARKMVTKIFPEASKVRSLSRPLHTSIVVCMDGNKAIPGLAGVYNSGTLTNQCLIKGDTKSFTIAAASILAKTQKDNEMHQLHKKFPMYNFASNKGYASKEHRTAIQKYGLCPEHRETFCTKFPID